MVGKNIRELRMKKDFSLRGLAEKAKISKSTLSDIENEKTNPTVTTLEKIADALEVPLDYLTRKSAKAIIEDKLEELNITLEDLSSKTKIPITFFGNLDNIIPDEGDYKRIQAIAWALNIAPIDLVNALHRQEPPITPEKLKEWDKQSNQVKESQTPYIPASSLKGTLRTELLAEEHPFTTPQAAMQFILKQPAIMGFGGFDVNKMSDDELIEFANELLNQLKLLSYKYKK